MKRLMVFPFGMDTAALPRYRELLSGYILVDIVAAAGNGYDGKAYGVVDGSMHGDEMITEEFGKAIERCDAVLFTESLLAVRDGYRYMESAGWLKKEIIVTKTLYDGLKQDKAGLHYDKLIGHNHQDIDEYYADKFRRKIETPIIMVYGLGDRCSKFDLQLGLRKHFLGQGYDVLQYGTKPYSDILGFKMLPDFLFDSTRSLEERIIALNHYMEENTRKRMPDLLIIGVPGGIAPYDGSFYNYFSEVPYIMSNALTPDISILSTYLFKEMNAEYFNNLRTYAKYKFNCLIDYFNISNTSYSVNKDNTEPELYFLNSKAEVVINVQKDNFKETDICVFNIYDQSYSKSLEKMEQELTENFDII